MLVLWVHHLSFDSKNITISVNSINKIEQVQHDSSILIGSDEDNDRSHNHDHDYLNNEEDQRRHHCRVASFSCWGRNQQWMQFRNNVCIKWINWKTRNRNIFKWECNFFIEIGKSSDAGWRTATSLQIEFIEDFRWWAFYCKEWLSGVRKLWRSLLC